MRYALLVLSCLTAAVYFQWRLGVMNPAFPAYSWIVLAAELAGFVRALLFFLSAVRITHHLAPPAPQNVSVDVFIPTYDEPTDLVRRTVLAALAIRYPHETWLLDDGQRAEMRDLSTELGCRYLARDEHADAKAGNLNHALALTHGEFIATFDADHVADPRFLDRTLGYFSDSRLAVVQTPQEFFNTDSFEHLRPQRALSNSASFFHRVVQRSRDASNSTIFTGTSAVLRRRALDNVGGFASATISEDVTTSLRLHAAGWRSKSHPEVLSAGLAPFSAAAYRGQRLRWAQDALQILLRERILTRPGLTAGQRFAYLIHVASNFEGWRHLFVYAMPIVILGSGILPVVTTATSFLIHFVPYLIATNLAFGELARGHGRPDESAVYNLARCPVALLATFTAHRERRFRVTPKTRDLNTTTNAFTYGLLLATMGAIAFALAQAFAGRSSFDTSTLAVVLAWAAYHVFTAVRLLLLERRCERDRRATTRLADTFPATLTRRNEPAAQYVVDVVAASVDGFTLRARDEAPAAGEYDAVIDVGGTRFSCELCVRETGLGAVVTWSDAATRVALDLLLHQRAVARFTAADTGDWGGVLRTA